MPLLALAAIAFVTRIGLRDMSRALRTGRVEARGNVTYDRSASPVGFWFTTVTGALWFLLVVAILARMGVLPLLFLTKVLG